jgi:hypothetical protein
MRLVLLAGFAVAALVHAQDEGIAPRIVLSLGSNGPLGNRGDRVTFELTASTTVCWFGAPSAPADLTVAAS